MDEKTLIEALLHKGFPREFCETLAKRYLNTDYTRMRMIGYLYRYEAPTMEDVVDEMLAILSDRDAGLRKKQMEEDQAKMNEIYNHGLGVEE